MFFKAPPHRNLFTERLRLRAPSFLDVSDVFEFCSDPASSKYADWYPHNFKSDTRDFLAWLKRKSSDKSYTWVIEHREDEKVIGTISIVDADYSGKIFTVGYTLSKIYQHNGYATEALKALTDYLFGELFAERVQAKVIPENEASCRLLERVGFKKEGTLKKGAFCKTECVDVFIYALTNKLKS
ncbi:MAG: GNAT family N-acetyltransferase [Clostridia bacterium]|nr:GNAT family N-acetyltransferase [Clostridia bacterium]